LERTARGVRTVRHEVFESRKFRSLEAVLRVFLGKPAPRVDAAAFGVAGPVVDDRCVLTNVDWVVDGRSVARRLSIPRVTLINDLVALALGALGVGRARLHVLGKAGFPKKKGGNIAVIAPGTGLGEAMLVWDREHGVYLPSPTEGGHTDFAPQDELEVALLRFLQGRVGPHVSWERILSGDGLGSLYDFFRESQGVVESAEQTRAIKEAPDRNAVVAQLGVAGTSEAASRAVDLFARLHGAEAGNLALKTLAVGGVYVCGNISARMLPVLDRGGFHEAFLAKGRQSPLLATVPIAVVLDADVGLAGATRAAVLAAGPGRSVRVARRATARKKRARHAARSR
jgi:glucokinase